MNTNNDPDKETAGDEFMRAFGEGDGGDAGISAGAGNGEAAVAGGGDQDHAAAGADATGVRAAEGEADPGAGAAAAGDAGAGRQGVDGSENGEQGRVQSQELNLDGLPDEIRQYIEAQNQRLTQRDADLAAARNERDSLQGRVAPLQQQLARLQASQRAAPQPAAPPAAPQPSAEVVNAQRAIEEAEAYFESDDFRKYAESWPDEAKAQKETQLRTLRAVKSVHEATAAQLGRIAPQVQSLQAERAESRQRTAVDALTERHPDWQEINVDPAFNDWLIAESVQLYDDADHRKRRLNDPNHVDWLLTRYKREIVATTSPPPQPDAGNNPPPPPSGAAARLAVSGGAAGPGPAPVRRGGGLTPADDFLAGFNSTD